MGFLAAPYLLLIQIHQQMSSGQAVGPAISTSLLGRDDDFSQNLYRWWMKRQQGDRDSVAKFFPRGLSRAFVETLDCGLKGEPILARLNELEAEMRLSMENTLATHLQLLPIKTLMPIMCLIFPALALLLVGPMLIHLLEELAK